MYKSKFKKFGGEWIPDIIEYIKEYTKDKPGVTISVGCDSVQKRRKTLYACTIMMYDHDIRNGAHVVFFRESLSKVRNRYSRLNKEGEYAEKIANYLHENLQGHYKRADIDDYKRKEYKFHVEKCEGRHEHVPLHNQENYINNLVLTNYEEIAEYKLVDIHLDYNPVLDDGKNISNYSYHTFVPELRGKGYRVFAKPLSYASTSAADLLLK